MTLPFNLEVLNGSPSHLDHRIAWLRGAWTMPMTDDSGRSDSVDGTSVELARRMAHDFNNLLSVIAGSLDLLTIAEQSDNAEHVARARQAVARGVRLTDQLLAFAHGRRMQPAVVATAPFLQKLSTALRREIPCEIALVVEVPDELWACFADPYHFESALTNLLINARDASCGVGRIAVRASNVTQDADDFVLVSVTDEGTGMTEEQRRQMFEPFFSTKANGTGLGLSIVEEFVSQSGGEIEVSSLLGVGTTVQFTLPRASQA